MTHLSADDRAMLDNVLRELKDAPRIELHIHPARAFVLLGAMQLAMRHPKAGELDPIVELTHELAEMISKLGPACAELARKGFDPQFDRE
jgi:hypothetical protein